MVFMLPVAITCAFMQRHASRYFRALLVEHDYSLCPECGYTLRGLPEQHKCPECGRAYELGDVRRLWRKSFSDVPEASD